MQEQQNKMAKGNGFIAALDQSGGSTPKALAAYGVDESSYAGEDEMFDLVHQMRTRIITSPVFGGDRILGAILFKETMERQIDGQDTADYLWGQKQIVPFLKVDNGLDELADGVQLMKSIPELDELLARAKEKHIFGTKMRSVIKEHNSAGISAVVAQQFELAKRIIHAGLVPIIEPEVDINTPAKAAIETDLKKELLRGLDALAGDQLVMLKLTIPSQANLYAELVNHPNVLRVVALSGGYERDEANEKLAQNAGLIASFSRALASDLRADQSDEEFDRTLDVAVSSIYEASTNKS